MGQLESSGRGGEMSTEQLGPIMRVIVGILAVAFVSWAGVVWNASSDLMDKFDEMMREFRQYSISTEHRLTKLEADNEEILEALRRMREDRKE